MKIQNLNFLVLSSILLFGCGSDPTHENLPNREVPLEMGVLEAIEWSANSETEPTPTVAPSLDPTPGNLSSTALRLGELSDELYLPIQDKWLKNSEKACNFFLITALCESGYCSNSKPYYRAGDFDDYFFEKGWILITLEELKTILTDQRAVDVVVQRDPPQGWTAGHVVIPVGITPLNTVLVAQGNLYKEWNEIREWSDSDFSDGFRIFAKY